MAIVVDLPGTSATSTLADLREQLYGRGFNFLDSGGGSANADRLLNHAYFEICDLEDWPFLYATTTGAPPVSISDLRAVSSVYDTVGRRHLDVTTYEELVQRCLDVALAGAPCSYWIDGLTTVKTWPVGGALTVRYVKYPGALSAGTDEPLIPARFRDIIVTLAAKIAAMDASATQDAQALQAEYDRRLEVMRDALLDRSRDTTYVRVTGSVDWGGRGGW